MKIKRTLEYLVQMKHFQIDLIMYLKQLIDNGMELDMIMMNLLVHMEE